MVLLSLKKIVNRPFNTISRIVTVGLVLSSLTVTILVNNSMSRGFLETTDKYDYILGSGDKGSQVCLNSVYYVNEPTSNLGVSYYNVLSKVKSIEKVVPVK